MRDTDKPEDKVLMAYVGQGAGGVYDAVKNGECSFGQFLMWLNEERLHAERRGYEEGYQDAKFYEN